MPDVQGWSTEFATGLLDDFDFTITESKFATDQKYKNGEVTLLMWEGVTDDIDVPTSHVWFPCGKGFSSKDGGLTIVHDSGRPDKNFVNTSLMARLISRVINDFEMGDLLVQRNGSPFSSATWLGMKFHMKSETIEYGSGIDSQAKVFPQRFLGVVDGPPNVAVSNGTGQGVGQSLSPAQQKLAERQAAAAAASSPASTVNLRDQLVTLAGEHTEFEAFQAAALEIPGVEADDALIDALVNPTGLWSEVKGG